MSPVLQAFPLLLPGYTACAFQYGQTASPGLPTYHDWIQVFRKSIPTFKAHALSDTSLSEPERQIAAHVFAAAFEAALDALAKHPDSPRNCAQLCVLRDQCLRLAGLGDIFRHVKQQENASALQVLPSVLADIDSYTDEQHRLECVVRGVFAGNIFDLGAASSAQRYAEGHSGAGSFAGTRDTLLPRPWAVDHLPAVLTRLSQVAGQRVLMFVDNAGSDVLLGMVPLARELIRLKARQVVLVANEGPTINDITASELAALLPELARPERDPAGVLGQAVASGQLVVCSSGSHMPVLDLAQVSRALCDDVVAAGCDLVVLEGMGRAIETNLHAQLRVDSLKLGMIKHPEVAACLNGRLYDCVCCFTPAAAEPCVQPAAARKDMAAAAHSLVMAAAGLS